MELLDLYGQDVCLNGPIVGHSERCINVRQIGIALPQKSVRVSVRDDPMPLAFDHHAVSEEACHIELQDCPCRCGGDHLYLKSISNR